MIAAVKSDNIQIKSCKKDSIIQKSKIRTDRIQTHNTNT